MYYIVSKPAVLLRWCSVVAVINVYAFRFILFLTTSWNDKVQRSVSTICKREWP